MPGALRAGSAQGESGSARVTAESTLADSDRRTAHEPSMQPTLRGHEHFHADGPKARGAGLRRGDAGAAVDAGAMEFVVTPSVPLRNR